MVCSRCGGAVVRRIPVVEDIGGSLRFVVGRLTGFRAHLVEVDRTFRSFGTGSNSAKEGIAIAGSPVRVELALPHDVRRRDLFIDVVAARHALRERREGEGAAGDKEEGDQGRGGREHAARGHPMLQALAQLVNRVERRERLSRKLPSGAHDDVEIADREDRHPKLNPQDEQDVLDAERNADSTQDEQEGEHRRDRIHEAFKERKEGPHDRHEHRGFCCPLGIALLNGLIEHDGRSLVAKIAVVPRDGLLVDGLDGRRKHELLNGGPVHVEHVERRLIVVICGFVARLALEVGSCGQLVDEFGILDFFKGGLDLLPCFCTRQVLAGRISDV